MENNRIKILAIDDNQDNLISLRALVRDFLPEARLQTALSGETGLALAATEEPDVILLDILMPGMDGFVVCRKLKADEKSCDIPVVFVTALKGDKETRIRALECGAEAFLAKPIDEIELTVQIKAMAKIKTANCKKREERLYLAALVDEQTRELKRIHTATLNLLEDLKEENEARKISEEALRRSDERYRLLAENASDVIWVMDAENEIFLYISPSIERLRGYSAEEVMKQGLAAALTPASLHYFRSVVPGRLERFRHGQIEFFTDEIEMIHKDGHNIWTEVNARYSVNRITGGINATGVTRDITARKLAEIELKKKNAEIEQFMYTVSHDLRSPLVTIKTFMGYLVKDMTEGNQEHLTQDIGYIHAAADKMKLLLDELLEMSRIGRVEAPPVRVPFRSILDDTLDILAGVINETKADIHLPDSELLLFGDRQRLHQLWQNLIENAIKYSSDGAGPRIELGVQQEQGETVFFVRDNGIGIDPRYLDKVFGIFEKLDPKSPGAGLGLCMVQRIVEKNGGRIWVESEGEGQGSCFRFTLPGAVINADK